MGGLFCVTVSVYTLMCMCTCVNLVCVFLCGCACVYMYRFSFMTERQIKCSLFVPSIIYSQWHWLYQAHTDNIHTLNFSQVDRGNFTVFKNLLVL